ncbi:MAG: helicase-related protein [Bacillota bacterium]|nr:helicase-related protein [Bacillota bacterium]
MANGFVKSLENIDYIPEKLILIIDGEEYTSDEVFDMGLRDSDWVSRAVAFSEDCSRRVVDKSVKILEQKLSDSDLPLKIIGVACSIKHAEQIKKLYEEAGMKTAILHSNLPDEEIDKTLSDIDNHRVQVVINVSMLGEGYDHRYLSVGAIFRPFRSQLPYEQFIGRLLRVIPDDEISGVEDNIAAVVSHNNLYLDKLWARYKQEIQKAEIIKSLEDLDLDLVSDQERRISEFTEIDIGLATEVGTGSSVADPYLKTELIRRREQEEAEDLRKIEELQKLLDVSFAEAKSIVNQSKARSRLLRPDLFEKTKKETVDQKIKASIVPKLLADFAISKESRSLANSRLFTPKSYAWIPKNCQGDNAAFLSIYINTRLKERMGRGRSEWQTSDWEIALQRLDEIEEYIRVVLKEFVD